MPLDELIKKLLELRRHHKETQYYYESADFFVYDPDNPDYYRRIENFKYDAGTVIMELQSEEWRKY